MRIFDLPRCISADDIDIKGTNFADVKTDNREGDGKGIKKIEVLRIKFAFLILNATVPLFYSCHHGVSPESWCGSPTLYLCIVWV